jgi:pimeloyl-ACP methyl ester carboxylesterase
MVYEILQKYIYRINFYYKYESSIFTGETTGCGINELSISFRSSVFKFQISEKRFENGLYGCSAKKPNGKTIMLLHGKNFNGAYWERTAKDLSDKGFRVIIPDQIGFGKSSKPQSYQFSFSQLAENTKAILDKLKIDKIIVLGHSMGGMVATRFTLQYPEKVEKLILENPIGLEDYKTFATYQTIDQAYQSELKIPQKLIKIISLNFITTINGKQNINPG